MGRQLRHQRRDRDRNAGAGRSSHHRPRHQPRVRERPRATRGSATTDRSSRTTCTTLTWDNPARMTDSPTAGPAQGRMALWPNTDMNTVSASGGLQAAGPQPRHGATSRSATCRTTRRCCRSRSTRALVVAGARPPDRRRQGARDGDELPASPRVRSNTLWFSARYRQYEFDNRTVPFTVEQRRQLRHGDRRAEPGERAVQPDAPHLRRRRDLLADPVRRVPRRLHPRGSRPHLSDRREDDRGHRPRVGRPHRPAVA